MFWNRDKYTIRRNRRSAIDPEEIFMDASHQVTTDTILREGKLELSIAAKNVQLLLIGIVVLALILVARLAFLDIARSSHYTALAFANETHKYWQEATRGVIYDSTGKQLVFNVPRFDADIIPADLPRNNTQLLAVITTLAADLSVPQSTVLAIVQKANFFSSDPVLVQANISHDQALLLNAQKAELPGVTVKETALRQYVGSPAMSPVLGYVGSVSPSDLAAHSDYLPTDVIGKEGLEEYYESYLRGKYGYTLVRKNALGTTMGTIAQQPSVPGDNLNLNINNDLQQTAYNSLEKWIATNKVHSGAAVALDPHTGQVLALVTYPSYDDNLFSGGISQQNFNAIVSNPYNPMLNRATAGLYPSASTIKPLYALSALAQNIIDPNYVMDTNGSLTVPSAYNPQVSYIFHDWRNNGPVDMQKAIAVSDDIYFYTIGGGFGNQKGLGIGNLDKYLGMAYFGKKSGIDLPQDQAGFIPTPAWKRQQLNAPWYIGDTYNLSIGQGYLQVTPLQIADYIAALVNGGNVMQPQIVHSITDQNGKVVRAFSPHVLATLPFSASQYAIVQGGMRDSVTEGTASILQSLPVQAAGKTGTAQMPNNKVESWFVGYAPANNPQIVMAVVMGEGSNGIGSAVTVFRDTMQWYFTQGPGKTATPAALNATSKP